MITEVTKNSNKMGSTDNLCLSPIKSFPNKPWFSCVCATILLETLWEKEKLLLTMEVKMKKK